MHTCIEIRETLFDFSPALVLVFVRLLEPLARRDTVNVTVKIIIIKMDLLLMESVFSLVLPSVPLTGGQVCLVFPSRLQSQDYHLIHIFLMLLLFFCLVLLLSLIHI